MQMAADQNADKVESRPTKTFPGRTLAGFLDRWFAGDREEGFASHTAGNDGGDNVSSYFAMRKSSLGRAPDGGLRPMLNNAFVFQTGMLDQV